MAKAIAPRRGVVAALASLAQTIRVALCRQNEIQFEAPWKPRQSPCG